MRTPAPKRARALLLAATLLGLTLWGAGGCGGPTDDPAPLARRSVALVLSDTLRADHLGFGGYSRDTSPFLDRLAAEGVVFARARSGSAITRESVSALFSGRLPSTSGSRGWHAAPDGEALALGELFRAAGYRTGFFTSTVMLADPRYFAGFDAVEQLARDKETRPGRGEMNAALTERALAFVEEAPERPFLLYLHYLDPHAPYSPPTDLRGRFRAPTEPSVRLYGDVRPRIGALLESGFGPGEDRFEDMVARYDEEIASVDRSLARLVEGLAACGARERTLLVFTSDHGEELLDHGFVEHGWTLYGEMTDVPLLFWAPGALAPARVELPVSTVDVRPTLVALLGLRERGDRSDGVPLFRAEGGALRPLGERAPVVSELLVPHRGVARAVVDGDWKLVQWRRRLEPEERSAASRRETPAAIREAASFDVFGPVVAEELFDLAADPRERENLVEREPARAAALRALLAAHEARARAGPRGGRALEAEEDSPELRRELEKIGY